MNVYDIGDVVRLAATFTNSAGVGVDPSSLTLQTLSSAGSLSTFAYGTDAIVRASAGNYYYDLSLLNLDSGKHQYRWNGFGANAAAEEGTFIIRTRGVG